MIKSLKNLALSGVLSTLSLFHANGQDQVKAEQNAFSSAAGKPRMLMLSFDMRDKTQDFTPSQWQTEIGFIYNGFSAVADVDSIGNGISTPADYQERQKEFLNKVEQDHVPYFFYLNAHGVLARSGTHMSLLGHEQQRGPDGSPVEAKVFEPSISIVAPLLLYGLDRNLPMQGIFAECEGDVVLSSLISINQQRKKLGQKGFAPGSIFASESAPGDVGFISTGRYTATPLNLREEPLKDLSIYQYDYNSTLFYNNSASYENYTSGMTQCRVKDDGEMVVRCPRMLAMALIGSGLEEADMDGMIRNQRSYAKANHAEHAFHDDEARKKLEEVSYYLKNATSYDAMPQYQQSACLAALAAMPAEKGEIPADLFVAFIEHERQDNQKKKTVRKSLMNTLPQYDAMSLR